VIEGVVTVLVSACPHALGLAVPLVVAISTALGAHSGLLVRDRRGLEEAPNVTAVFFDKTGTLTRAEFRVVEITPRAGVDPDKALALAAAVERDSEHTIAHGTVKSAEERKLDVPRAERFQAIPERGAQASVNGRQLLLGGPALLRQLNAQMDAPFQAAIERAAAPGQSAITMVEGTSPLAVFAVADAIRDESGEAIQRLHAQRTERGDMYRVECPESPCLGFRQLQTWHFLILALDSPDCRRHSLRSRFRYLPVLKCLSWHDRRGATDGPTTSLPRPGRTP